MTKKYGDEAIIKMRRAYQKLKYNSLSTGIFVKEQLISFREQEIDSLGTRMILPEVMEPMEEEMKKRKYPMEKRPAIIWSDPDGIVSITISFLSQGIESDALEQVRDDLGNTILSISPHYMFWIKEKLREKNDHFIGRNFCRRFWEVWYITFYILRHGRKGYFWEVFLVRPVIGLTGARSC